MVIYLTEFDASDLSDFDLKSIFIEIRFCDHKTKFFPIYIKNHITNSFMKASDDQSAFLTKLFWNVLQVIHKSASSTKFSWRTQSEAITPDSGRGSADLDPNIHPLNN
jgi:hypothetical protein